MSNKPRPDFALEDTLMSQGFSSVAGIDEAGRGPWAGPVVAAAVILDAQNFPAGLQDSKKLSAKKRELVFSEICDRSVVGVGICGIEEIDRLNILQASLMAMARALGDLSKPADYALIDGNKCPQVDIPCNAVVKGDGKVLSIAAASIIAKVTRDRIMLELGTQFPGYGWERNMGYGTKEHREGLEKHGVTPHHRRSFAPIKKLIDIS